ncbi:endo-1,4-beta-xylanase [Anaerocellum diazotrophicum]|uniref:Beta-xylanase n=1 Tax=Caldicellulosiruptor diazotrophicus TaxID=2806205 RepID=A0ABM7NJX4_9FIRM|nr:endo-1,4-beta-xylanase [Caldicellulosiruptor diazotrophicus]BCS80404.1 hypothetical protein CaldiYA01_03640 [Caldicellulosiruptor diazotrophicus]
MKKRLIAFLVMLIFVISLLNPIYQSFLTPVAKAQSSQTNLKFDFENGTQGWTGRGTSTTVSTVYGVAYEGDYSLKVSGRNSSWDGAVVDITSNVSVNTTYTVSMFVYHNDAKPQRFAVYVYVKDSASEKYIQIADKVVMPNYWKQIFGKFTISTSNPLQIVKLLVCVPSNKSVEFYADSVIVTSAQSTSSGIVKSSTFESGSTEGWQARGTGSDAQISVVDTVAHLGSKSLYVTGRAQTWQGAQIDFTNILEKGKEYQFSIWVYQNSGSDQKITLTMERKNADNTTNYDTIKWQQTVPSGVWTEITGSYQVPQTAIKLTFYVESPNATLSFYLDDFSAVDKNPPVVNPGLIKSCTFESGSTEEFVPRGGTVSLTVYDNVYYHSGTKALYVSGRTSTWHGAQMDLTSLLEKGKEYQFSIWVYQDSGSDQKITLTMQRKNSDNTTSYDSIKYQQTVPSGTWTEVSGSYQVPQTATQLVFYVESPNATLSFYLDDFTVIDKNPITIPTAAKQPEWEIPSLCQHYSQYFSIGVAIPYKVLQNPVESAMVLKHFNSITAENEMKPDALQRTEGQFNFTIADQYVNFAQNNNIGIRGHTLVWHQQTPSWFFQHSDGTALDPSNPEDKQLLRDRLKTHIQTVMSRYQGKIYAWDVVNEAIDENQPDGYRRSEWYRILGPTPETGGIPEYIILAFQYARQADPSAKLFYNDYNTENPKKRQFIYNMVKKLHDMNLIDGVGLQGHINVDSPTVKEIENTINLFSTIPGLEIQITELDISVYTSSSQRYDTLPQDIMIKQALKFKELFEMLKRHSDRITNVTLWGLKDDYSWLSKDRNNWPLLFDSNYQAKYSYWAIVEPSVLPLAINKAYAINASAAIDGVMDREYKGAVPIEIKDDSGNTKATARALWNTNEVYLYVYVNDSTYNPSTDYIMVCIDQDNAKLPELKADDFWAIITRGGVLTELQDGKIAAYKVVSQQGSYVVEAKIILDNQLAKGSNIGFDLVVRDDTNVFCWNDKTNSQLYATDNYGILSMTDSIKFATVYKGTPRIDGNEDPIWDFATQITTQTPIQVSGTVYATAYANVKLLWDETALYIWADVYDPLLNKANVNPWEQDSIEFFVDENNHKTSFYEDDDVQYRVNYENTQTFGTNGSAQNFITNTKITPFGYTVEAKVYMRTTNLSEGMIIGFDVQVNDADHTGKRVNIITWNDKSGNDWRDTTGFGCIELAGINPQQAKRIYANYGSPDIDGEVDEIWDTVDWNVPAIYSTSTQTSGKFKLLWDDKALYVLAEVYDQVLNSANSTPYQQDSVEVFIDENFDRAISYQPDDLHYRVNYDNLKTTDAGDILRFYTKTKLLPNGYRVEARIALNIKPTNGTIMGFEFQINEADSSGRRVATINMFDRTGNAWQNPSLFGEVKLIGRPLQVTPKLNPYDLMCYLEYAKSIDKHVFINGNILNDPIAEAEILLQSGQYTQQQLDSALEQLKNALNNLRRSDKYPEPETMPIIEQLPDPFTFSDGSKVQRRSDWSKRAAELKDLYQFYMYGYKPDSTVEEVTYTLNGNTLTITVKKGGKQASFNATVSLPTSQSVYEPPYPVIISLGYLASFDWTTWQFINYAPIANKRGYAVVTFMPNDVASDDSSYRGAFYTLYPRSKKVNEDTGVLMAWAWGASKILDVLYKGAIPEIDPTKAIVTGFSRYGKAALVAGAFDDRFAVVNPHASGQGGAGSFRIKFDGKQYPWGVAGNTESFANLQGNTEAHWFNSVFLEFKDPRQLPFDQHELIALCAPRTVIITGGYSDWGTNPEGTWVSYIGARKVYEFLGIPDKIGFALRDGSHAITLEDIANLLDFCDWQLRGIIPVGKDFSTSRFTIDPAWDTIVVPTLYKNPNLKQLVISAGTLSFNKDVISYNISVPYETTAITVTAVPEAPTSIVYINDVQSNTRAISLNVGANTVRIKVVADDGSTKVYTINITRNTVSSPSTVMIPTPSTGTTTTTTQQTQRQQQTQQQTQTTTQQQQTTSTASQNIATVKLEADKPATIRLGQDIKVVVSPDAVTSRNALIKVEKIEKLDTGINIGINITPAIKLTVENADFMKPVPIEIKVDPVSFKEGKIPVAFVIDETNKAVLVPVKKEVNKVVVNATKEGAVVVVAAKLEEVYKDVTKNYWAYDTFKQAVTSGLVVGYNDMTLKPSKNVTLAEAAVIVQRAFEVQPKDMSNKPANVPGWALSAIKALLDNEVISEVDDANRPLTRIEAVSIIMKVLEKVGVNVEPAEIEFSDLLEQSSTDVEYLTKAYKLGIVKGYPDGTFRPQNTITRAEFLTLLFRALSNLKK